MRRSKSSSSTARARMTHSFPIAQLGDAVSNLRMMIERSARDFATIDYVYIVDGKRVLQGVISIKELLATADSGVKVEEIMKRELVTAHPSTHQ